MDIVVRRAEIRDTARIRELLLQVCHVHAVGRPDIFREVRFYPWTQGRYSGAIGAACQVLDQKIELAASGMQA